MPKNSDTLETSHEPMIATCTDKKNICLRCNFFQTAYAIYLHGSQKNETTSWKLFLIVRPFILLKKLYRPENKQILLPRQYGKRTNLLSYSINFLIILIHFALTI